MLKINIVNSLLVLLVSTNLVLGCRNASTADVQNYSGFLAEENGIRVSGIPTFPDGTHVIISDLHLRHPDLAQNQSNEQVFQRTMLLLKMVPNVKAITLNGDAIQRHDDWDAPDPVIINRRLDEFRSIYLSILSSFNNSVHLFVNMGDHDLPKLRDSNNVVMKYSNNDDMINLQIGHQIGAELQKIKNLSVIGYDPRQNYLYKPFQNSPDIRISHIGYDLTKSIESQVKIAKEWGTIIDGFPGILSTIGKLPREFPAPTDVCNLNVMKISGDGHFPYYDESCNVYNSGTTSATVRSSLVPTTIMLINAGKVEYYAYSKCGLEDRLIPYTIHDSMSLASQYMQEVSFGASRGSAQIKGDFWNKFYLNLCAKNTPYRATLP